MSHFTSVKTEIFERSHLINALNAMEVVQKEKATVTLNDQIRGWNKKKTDAEVGLVFKDKNYDVGFNKGDNGSYEAVADWSMSGLNMGNFMDEVKRRYALSLVKEQCEAMGFMISEERQNAEGEVRMVVRKW